MISDFRFNHFARPARRLLYSRHSAVVSSVRGTLFFYFPEDPWQFWFHPYLSQRPGVAILRTINPPRLFFLCVCVFKTCFESRDRVRQFVNLCIDSGDNRIEEQFKYGLLNMEHLFKCCIGDKGSFSLLLEIPEFIIVSFILQSFWLLSQFDNLSGVWWWQGSKGAKTIEKRAPPVCC